MKLRKPIGVNLRNIAGYSLVGGLSKPDFLLVGATGRVAPTEYKMSDFAVLTPTYEELKLTAIP